MRSVDDILKRASQLSPEERRKLIDSLEEGLADEQASSSTAASICSRSSPTIDESGQVVRRDADSSEHTHVGQVPART